MTGAAGEESQTQVAVELPFGRDDTEESLATLLPDLDASGEFVVNEGIIEWNKEEDTFQDVLDRINSNSDSNVLTQVETTSDPRIRRDPVCVADRCQRDFRRPDPPRRPRGQLHRRLGDQDA